MKKIETVGWRATGVLGFEEQLERDLDCDSVLSLVLDDVREGRCLGQDACLLEGESTLVQRMARAKKVEANRLRVREQRAAARRRVERQLVETYLRIRFKLDRATWAAADRESEQHLAFIVAMRFIDVNGKEIVRGAPVGQYQRWRADYA